MLLSCSEVMLKDDGLRRLRLRCIPGRTQENKLREYKGVKQGPYKGTYLRVGNMVYKSVESGSRVTR